jgi:hypothetical protein
MPIQPLDLEYTWGSYFKPDAADEKAIVEVAGAAVKHGLIDRHHAIRKIAPVFGVEDTAALVEAVEKEREEEEAKLAERENANAHALANAVKAPAVGGKPKPPAPKG